jgi:hypothetical protein
VYTRHAYAYTYVFANAGTYGTYARMQDYPLAAGLLNASAVIAAGFFIVELLAASGSASSSPLVASAFMKSTTGPDFADCGAALAFADPDFADCGAALAFARLAAIVFAFGAIAFAFGAMLYSYDAYNGCYDSSQLALATDAYDIM